MQPHDVLPTYAGTFFGRFGATKATLIALAIFLFQIFVSALWLKYFAYGPMEWIWRQLTYGRRLSLLIKHQEAAVDTPL